MSVQQLYRKPVVLNSIIHRALKVSPVRKYDFASSFNSCILLGQEFPEAAKCYPVVFSRTDETISPVAIVGIHSNLFVDDEGKWERGFYVPAFIRRYPYILSENPSQDGEPAVFIDSEYEGFDAEDGERLFNDIGEKTPALDKAMAFLRLFQDQFQSTNAFVDRIKALDIFKPVDANLTLAGGQRVSIKNLSRVDEKALQKLKDDQIVELVRSGDMAWIYAHLHSLGNFKRIVARASREGEANDVVVSEEKARQ